MPVTLSRPWTAPKSTTGLVKFNLNYSLQSQLTLPAHSVSMKADKFPRGRNALFTLSADSEEELENLINQHVLLLKNNSNAQLSESSFPNFIISSTSSDTKKPGKHRIAIIVPSFQEIQTSLIDRAFLSSQNSRLGTRRPKIAFLFTGQGSQYFQMAKSLYTSSSVFNQAFNSAATLLQDIIDIPIWDVIWGNEKDQLDNSIYSQTSIFCIECGLVALWKSFGIKPDYVLGPSAGGFAAAVASKMISLQDGVKLVSERSKLISALPRGGMTSVKANVPTVNSLIASCTQNSDIWLDIAVINSEDDIVVAGRPEALDQFEMQCQQQGLKYLRLAAAQAFHSREIEAILEDYGDILESVGGQECLPDLDGNGCPYISGVNGNVLNKEDFSTSYWQSHARDPVDLPKAINTLWDEGCRVFIEVGPSLVLLRDGINILGQTKAAKGMWLPSIRKDQDNWDTILGSLAKLYVSGFELNLC